VKREWDLLALDFDPTPGIVPYVELASDPGKAFGQPEHLIDEFINEQCWPVYAHPDDLNAVGSRSRPKSSEARRYRILKRFCGLHISKALTAEFSGFTQTADAGV
jgi:hypothetical protein